MPQRARDDDFHFGFLAGTASAPITAVIPHALRHAVLLRRCGIVTRKRRSLGHGAPA
jgi:hypothetical protein